MALITPAACGPEPVGTPNPKLLTPLTGALVGAFVGDSVTRGIPGSGTGDAYRLNLWNNFQADRAGKGVPSGLTVTWIGPQNTGSAPTNNNDGINGATIGTHTPSELSAISAQVDFIVIILGNGDAANGQSGVDSFYANYTALIKSYRNTFPGIRFLVSTPIYSNSFNAFVTQIDNFLPDLWSSLQSTNTPLAITSLQNVLIFPDDFLGDNIHPNAGGNVKIATALRAQFLNLLGYP